VNQPQLQLQTLSKLSKLLRKGMIMKPAWIKILWKGAILFMAGGLAIHAETKPAAKEIMVWVSPESPREMWLKGYGEVFPADYMFQQIAEAGFTDVEFQAQEGRGPNGSYHNTRVEHASRCNRMGDRDWLEESLTAADRYNLKLWLVLTPSYRIKNTDIGGLDDPRHIKIWTDLVEEYGTAYKPRHPSLAGIYLHEVHCAEAPDVHSDELEAFSAFCEKHFGEKYPLDTMPDGKANDKWQRRFFLYKNEIITKFTRIMRKTADRFNMETIFCLYSPEIASNSAVWGYDSVALEENSDRLWVVIQAEYRDLKNSWQDTGQGYKGSNVPFRQTMAFHGKPVSVFESRFILFPQVPRKYYQQYGNYTKIHGDFLNGYLKKSEKVLELFTGVENVKKWNQLHAKWLGAESKARIALIASSRPFVLRFPDNAGKEYRKVFTPLLDALKNHFLADAQVAGSQFTLDTDNLLKYDLMIIPQEMGLGLDDKFLDSIRRYLASGRKILVLGSGLSSASLDLEKQIDHSEELLGVRIAKEPQTASVTPHSTKIPRLPEKSWQQSFAVEVTSADEVLITDRVSGQALLTRKGNAYYLAFGQDFDNGDWLASLLEWLAPQPAALKNNSGFRFSAMTCLNNMLCVALPCEKAASAVLVIDSKKLGLEGDRFELRNIITGKTVCTTDAAGLLQGIAVKTDYDSEPCVLVVGQPQDVAEYSGIYPDNSVFADMGKINIVENPEVAIAISDKPGIKVGVYQNAYGAEEIYTQLNSISDFNCFYLPRLDNECMAQADVIVIPQAKSSTFFTQGKNEIREMVRRGKGLLLTHDATLVARELFPSLLRDNQEKIMRVQNNALKVVGRHPVTANLEAGEQFIPGFAFDHYSFVPGWKASTLAEDTRGNKVILAGPFEKGKVVLFGTLPGVFSTWDDCDRFLKDRTLEGTERQLLINAVHWLAKKE